MLIRNIEKNYFNTISEQTLLILLIKIKNSTIDNLNDATILLRQLTKGCHHLVDDHKEVLARRFSKIHVISSLLTSYEDSRVCNLSQEIIDLLICLISNGSKQSNQYIINNWPIHKPIAYYVKNWDILFWINFPKDVNLYFISRLIKILNSSPSYAKELISPVYSDPEMFIVSLFKIGDAPKLTQAELEEYELEEFFLRHGLIKSTYVPFRNNELRISDEGSSSNSDETGFLNEIDNNYVNSSSFFYQEAQLRHRFKPAMINDELEPEAMIESKTVNHLKYE